jgi:hypothetical protein
VAVGGGGGGIMVGFWCMPGMGPLIGPAVYGGERCALIEENVDGETCFITPVYTYAYTYAKRRERSNIRKLEALLVEGSIKRQRPIKWLTS